MWQQKSKETVAKEVKIGILLGFTGPIESLTPDMARGAELAMSEVSGSKFFLNGSSITPVRGDSTCVDSQAATARAEMLITSDGVSAIMGADCSGVTTAVLKNVAKAKGTLMISPSATSPALSTEPDDDLFLELHQMLVRVKSWLRYLKRRVSQPRLCRIRIMIMEKDWLIAFRKILKP